MSKTTTVAGRLAEKLNIPASKHDYVTPYFGLEKMDPDVWTFPVSTKGIKGIELMHKAYGIWKNVVKQNNLGRVNGTDSSKVGEMIDDIRTNFVDPKQPPVFIDIDTGDIITGGHRYESSAVLGIPGWMFQYVRCSDAWARKRFAKALNNERVFACTLNDKAEVIEHIKYGIKEGKITCEQDIEDEAVLIAGHGCCKSAAVRATIVKEMVSFIANNGITSVQLERYTSHNEKTYADFLSRSTDDYVKDVINSGENPNYYVNMDNWGSRTNPIIVEAAKCRKDQHLNIQASVSLPSARESLEQKRDKVHGTYFSNLSETLDTLFSYRFTNSCYPWDHPDCEHAFLAQDHHKEGVIEGQFIRKSK